METAARRQALRLAAWALEQRLNADTSDHMGPQLPCACGAAALYHGRRCKTFASVLGLLHLERAYYHCAQCQSGSCPRDRILGLGLFSLTPGVAESLGAEIARAECERVEKVDSPTPTMYLGMDGTGVPMRPQEVAHRAGKQADGSAKTREAKLVTVWTAESRDEEGKPVRDPGSVTYSAAIESAATPDTSPEMSAFAERVIREANRRAFTQAPRQVVLGDGAAWIWNTAAELFPQAILILDRFHAKEHLSKVGKAIYGDSIEAQKWIQLQYDKLDEERLAYLVQALRPHAGQSKEARDCIHYIWANRRRMRYLKFRKQGLCIASGVVEAGCKVVIGTRLKRAGMHWTVNGANAIIALRCNKLSGRFEDFWQDRSDQFKVAA